MSEIIAEYGGKARFAQGRMYDSDGNEINVPKCTKCNTSKCLVLGKKVYTWLCPCGCDRE